MSYLLRTLRKKEEVDSMIRDTIDKLLVLRFGRSSDSVCLQLDDILSKSEREVSKFASIALVDVDSEEIQVYLKYFDITFIPSTVFFFNAHHMKMDSGVHLRNSLARSAKILPPNPTFEWDTGFVWLDNGQIVVRPCPISGKRNVAIFTGEILKCNRLNFHETMSADHTKWVGAFHRKQDFIDVVEEIFRGAMKGKLIVNCPLPPERIPKFQLLYKDM